MQWKRQGKENEKSLGSRCKLCLQSLSESLFLTLAFHLHQILGVLGARVVDAALGLLLALPATGALVLVVGNGLGGVPVSNTLVATVKQLIVGNIVFLDILLDLVEGPVGHGVDLDETSLVDFDDIKVTTLATLATTTASKDGVYVHLTVSPLGRLNLGNPVVKLVISFPETGTILGLEFGSGLRASGLVDMHVVVGVTLANAFNQIQSLLEVVQSVEED